MVAEKNIKFPKGFYWGASSASHQVEGNCTNNWSEWEKSEKRRKYLKSEGLIEKHGLNNYISGIACDHYNLYKQDYRMAKDLGHNATRFSLEWSRIEPKEGEFDKKEIEHYRGVIKYIRSLGMEPFVTIYHWTQPLWFRDKGGWEKKENIKHFIRFAEKVVKEYKDDVKFWITLNEPDVYASSSYLSALWPPQTFNLPLWIVVVHNLIEAHNQVYPVIKGIDKDSQVGIAKNNANLKHSNKFFLNSIATRFFHWVWNNYFLNKINECQDFIGLNYYFKYNVNLLQIDFGKIISSVGKKLAPAGIYDVLMDLKKYNKPVYITENGLPDGQDKYRTWYLFEIMNQMYKAIEDGVDLRGYLHWSLTDNFEWHKGRVAKFGLVAIDYKTQERKPRQSAYFYKEVCINNGITENMLKKFNIEKPV